MKYIQKFENSLLFSGYHKFSEGDIVVLLTPIFPFNEGELAKILKVDEAEQKKYNL
jgi:hypothetical protein